MRHSARKRVDFALRNWIDVRFQQATQSTAAGKAQEGSRSAVTGGRHLDAVDRLVREELTATGARGLKFLTGRDATLPGFYRATKSWDLLALQDGNPVLAVEYKSMKGSEGKNLNNRADEVFGVAEDLRQAEIRGLLPATMRRAYVFVMGVTPDSLAPRRTQNVAAGETDPIFDGVGYLERAAIMCERMQETGLYHFAWAVGVHESPFSWVEPRPAVTWENFARGLGEMFEDGEVRPLPKRAV
ncbi:PaeR7I family type II restriction endonuclease [Streptomyces sp. NPDC088197]|uniref:PaeR7I family type II restriction endonuclease n=1 Tax=unclassified Streptomyces TaxID=2593676 RepID=UPI0036E7DEDB